MGNKYDLKIIGYGGQKYKQYNIDDQETIGVFENEQFSVEFSNNMYVRVQVKLAIDGTNVLTGKLADTKSEGKMFVVEPYSKLELTSWVESMNGGASFIFGKESNSVASNTHGNMSAKGIIAAAVYEEGYVEPVRITTIDNGTPKRWDDNTAMLYGPNFNTTNTSTHPFDSFGARADTKSARRRQSNTKGVVTRSLSLDEDNLAVGAGEYVEQKITKTAGLKQPKLAEVIQICYKSWDSMRSLLRGKEKVEPQWKGFPADECEFIDLGRTPRIQRKQKYIDFKRFE